MNFKIMLPVCVWAWLMNFLDLAFNILPVLHPDGYPFQWIWLQFGCFAFMGGFLARVFLKKFQRHPPYPQRDPRLLEAMGIAPRTRKNCPTHCQRRRCAMNRNQNTPDVNRASGAAVGFIIASVIFIVLVVIVKFSVSVPAIDADRAATISKALYEIRTNEVASLNNAGWIDKQRGIVRLPIETAMQIG